MRMGATQKPFWCLAAILVVTVASLDLEGSNLGDLDFNTIFSVLPSKSINANKGIDRVLELLSGVVPNRVKVPDIGTELNIHDCYVEGLSNSILRAGDVSLNISNTMASFTFGLAVNDISIKCTWERKVFKALTLTGTVSAAVNKVGVSSAINVNLQPGEHLNLDEFRVLHLDEIQTKFTGLGFLNKLANRLSNIVITSSRERLISKLEGEVAEKLQRQLMRVKVPKL